MYLKKMIHKKNQLFFIWLLSYISVLIVPLVISILLYMASGQVIEDEINKANGASMLHLKQIVDDHLKSLRNIGVDIGWDRQVVDIMRQRPPLGIEYHQIMVNILNDLKVKSSSNRLIDFVYIYCRNSDMVLSSNARNEGREIYEFYHQSPSFTYDDWYEIMNGVHPWDYVSLPRVIQLGKANETIAFLQTVPIEYPNGPLGTIVIMVDRAKFEDILKSAKWVNESNIFILDKNNRILASTNPVKLPETLTYESLVKPGQFIDAYSGDEEVVVTYLDSSANDWKYVSVIPKKIFLSKAKLIRNLTFAGIFFCLAMGGIAAYLFSKKNYNPVRRILETIANRAGLAFDAGGNEYDFINRSIELTADLNEQINRKLREQYGILRSNFLLRLIKGNIGENIPIEEALSNYDMVFCSEYFAVMLFIIDDLSRFFPREKEKTPGESVRLAKYVIANVAKELVEKTDKAFLVEVDETIVCLINFKHSDGRPRAERMEEIAAEARRNIQQEFEIQFTVAISSVHENLFGIPAAYQEAVEALEYKLVVGQGYIISYDAVKKAENDPYDLVFSLEQQQKFMNCIKAGEMEAAGNMMENVIDSSLCQVSIPIAMARCLMFAMVNTMINAVRELSIVCEKSFLEQLNPVERLLRCRTAMEMKSEMRSILGGVGAYIAVSKREKTSNLVAKVKQYIAENYSDSNLSVSMISEHFDMNAAYLSRYMKEQTGEGLLDCINRIRLEKAKQWLGKKTANINEIAERVGYYNSNAFIRSFKKYEGITPGKYKELQQDT